MGNNPIRYVDPDGRFEAIFQYYKYLNEHGYGLKDLSDSIAEGWNDLRTEYLELVQKSKNEKDAIPSDSKNSTVDASPSNQPEPDDDDKDYYNSNPKHNQNAKGNISKEPANAKDMFEKSVKDPNNPNTRWYKDRNGKLHRFQGSNHEYHWNGSFDGKPQNIPGFIDKSIRFMPKGDF